MLFQMSNEAIISPQARATEETSTSSRDSHSVAEAGEPSHDVETEMANQRECTCAGNKRAFFTVGILFFINLLNYMDRFTIAGILVQIQAWFRIKGSNNLAGLLQTVFICSYMVLAPVFGYMGDRFRRKYLMAVGIFIWSVTVFASTFMGHDSYGLFLLLRGIVGIGEASYSTIAPTIIADLFTGDMRTRMLSIFYFAIPVGSGLGYVVGSQVAGALNHWQWGMRVTPVLGVASVILCVLVVHEPQRGAIERGISPSVSASNVHMSTGYLADLAFIFKTKSFLWLTAGFTCVSFVTGALAFWAPKFMYYASLSQGLTLSEEDVSYRFGIITVVAGIVGVWLGAEVARRYRVHNGRADAIVCAVGLISCTPFLYGALALARHNMTLTYMLVFIGEVLLCMNWAPVADIVLYVIIPTRRSTAEAMQILVSHMFGDAGSPWLIGVVSDTIRGDDMSNEAHARSMEYALYITTFISVVGGLCFIICAFYVIGDRANAEKLTQKPDEDDTSLLSSVVGAGEENEGFPKDEDSDSGVEGNGRAGSGSDNYYTAVDSNDTEPLVVPVQIHNGAAQNGVRQSPTTGAQAVII